MRFHTVQRKTQRLILALTFFSLVGCSSTKKAHRWTTAALKAEQEQTTGNYDAALSKYDELLKTAPTTERRRWLEFNTGEIFLARGETDKARDLFVALHDERRTKDPYGASALLRLAETYDAEDRPRADKLRWELVETYPNSHAAERAFYTLKDAADDWRTWVQKIDALGSALRKTELEDNAWFETGMVHKEHGEPNEAMLRWRRVYEENPKLPLADDALWEISRVYLSHQEFETAVEVLNLLSKKIESSWFVGSYNSDWIDDAIYEAGMIQLLFLDDYDGAIRSFNRFLKEFPGSIHEDDAAWGIIQAKRLAGNDSAYLAALKRFVRDYPESRFLTRAKSMLGGDA